MAKQNRYKQMERNMIYVLLGTLAAFILYLIVAGMGIIWLKVVLAILIIPVCVLCFVFLYLTGELLRSRSLWMTTAAASIFICLVFSLILNFP